MEKLDLLECIPKNFTGRISGICYEVNVEYDKSEIIIYYEVTTSNWKANNCGTRQFSAVIPRYIEIFEDDKHVQNYILVAASTKTCSRAPTWALRYA